MRLLPSDPDIKTLADRIEDGEIDLTPDFQRGEVWSLSKRQKLIDSVLRDWHIPPVHVIEKSNGAVSVLDGQQRLASIRDFVADEFCVDGAIAPYEEKIARLHGLRFSELPPQVRKRLLRFTIRLFTIVDYKAAEPGELFYRLNQPTSLTPAEQRNAFFGTARSQVKELVSAASDRNDRVGIFGFSNARMTYDDAITRALFLLSAKSLRQKVTAAALADKFRSDRPFSPMAVRQLRRALEVVSQARLTLRGPLKLNKATAESWLIFLASAQKRLARAAGSSLLVEFFIEMEECLLRGEKSEFSVFAAKSLGRKTFASAIETYINRSTSRVADVSSVVLRDMVLWMFFFAYAEFRDQKLLPVGRVHGSLRRLVLSSETIALDVESIADHLSWGGEL